MKSDAKTGQVTATTDEIAMYNMLLTEAIFEILTDKGLITGKEILDRVEKLEGETTLNFNRLQ
jgi:hypothetical protein